jgi:HK97 gp10 family phage protein
MAIIGYGKRGGSLKTELTGILSTKGALDKMSKNVEKELEKQIKLAAINTGKIARDSIQRGSKTGNVYTHTFVTMNGQAIPIAPRAGQNLSATHQASAKGEAPATDTGRLVSSITQEQSGDNEWIVGSRVDYSKWLEFGTRKIGERPFLRPALTKAGKEFEKRMLKALGGRKSRLKDFMTTGVQRG